MTLVIKVLNIKVLAHRQSKRIDEICLQNLQTFITRVTFITLLYTLYIIRPLLGKLFIKKIINLLYSVARELTRA